MQAGHQLGRPTAHVWGRLRSSADHEEIKNRKAGRATGVGNLVRSIKRELLPVLLDAGRAEPGKAVLVDRVLPGQEFLDRQGVAAARLFERQHPPRTAATTSALRRMTRRFVPGAGKSAMVRGEPSGPMTYLTLGRWGSVIFTLTTRQLQLATLRTAA